MVRIKCTVQYAPKHSDVIEAVFTQRESIWGQAKGQRQLTKIKDKFMILIWRIEFH